MAIGKKRRFLRRAAFLWAAVVVCFLAGTGKRAAADNVFLLEDSGTRYLTEQDIAGFSPQKLNYARNEVYARYGRLFQSRELMDYFGLQSWYRGSIPPEKFDNNTLNTFERANVQFLLQKENSLISGGYPLDQPGYNIYAVYQDSGQAQPSGTVPAAGEEVYDASGDAFARDDSSWDDFSWDEWQEWYYITSTYSKGIAMHPAPDKNSAILARLPHLAVFPGKDRTGNYVYTCYEGVWGWVNTQYAARVTVPGDLDGCFSLENWYEIVSTYAQGIAVHPVPEKDSDVIGRIGFGEEFFVYSGWGSYGFTVYDGGAGWINLDYAREIDYNEDYYEQYGPISEDDACTAMFNYMDTWYDMDALYRNRGWFHYDGENNGVYRFRLYTETGDYGIFYVYEDTAEIYVQWRDPVTSMVGELDYVGNAWSYAD